MQPRVSARLISIAILSIIFLAGIMFDPSSASAQRGGPPLATTPTAFQVQAADFIPVEESNFTDPFAVLVFTRTRTPVSVSDPTTGEPIDDQGPNNFALDQFGALQACGLVAPPPSPQSLAGFIEKPFDFAVANLGNGFYALELLPTTSEGCVGNSVAALQIRVFDGIRKGQTASNGFVFGPFCNGL